MPLDAWAPTATPVSDTPLGSRRGWPAACVGFERGPGPKRPGDHGAGRVAAAWSIWAAELRAHGQNASSDVRRTERPSAGEELQRVGNELAVVLEDPAVTRVGVNLQ